jgi:hypothetical protein
MTKNATQQLSRGSVRANAVPYLQSKGFIFRWVSALPRTCTWHWLFRVWLPTLLSCGPFFLRYCCQTLYGPVILILPAGIIPIAFVQCTVLTKIPGCAIRGKEVTYLWIMSAWELCIPNADNNSEVHHIFFGASTLTCVEGSSHVVMVSRTAICNLQSHSCDLGIPLSDPLSGLHSYVMANTSVSEEPPAFVPGRKPWY